MEENEWMKWVKKWGKSCKAGSAEKWLPCIKKNGEKKIIEGRLEYQKPGWISSNILDWQKKNS